MISYFIGITFVCCHSRAGHAYRQAGGNPVFIIQLVFWIPNQVGNDIRKKLNMSLYDDIWSICSVLRVMCYVLPHQPLTSSPFSAAFLCASCLDCPSPCATISSPKKTPT